MENYKPKPLAFFLARIGKRLYRDADNCDCSSCKDVVENGLIVTDKGHAYELAEVDMVWAAEGIFLNYRDEK